jgi:hypothetical protein
MLFDGGDHAQTIPAPAGTCCSIAGIEQRGGYAAALG